MRLTSPSQRSQAMPGSRGRVLPRIVSQVQTMPPPVGGWNTRDAISAMDPTDAIILDNWMPQRGGVRLRKGLSSWATGIDGTYVESLMPYTGPSTTKLFAADPAKIWDVTNAGAATSSVTSLSNGRWSHTMFNTAAGNYLYICNGADTPRYYNGTAWANSTFTGPSSITTLDYVCAHMNRLWFIDKATLNTWYGGTSSIAGALTQFIPPFKLGGYMVAIASWTRDGGSGPDDNLVFLTSTGECAIYQGTDPASATTWGLVGIFKLPEPIGRRCIMPLGADLAIITSSGVIPLSTVLSLNAAGVGQAAITSKITGAFSTAYQVGSALFGWQFIEYPMGNMAIVNVPEAERVTQMQFAVNTITGAWCRFTGMNVGCWALFNGTLYAGGNVGKVYKFDQDFNDDNVAISATMQTSYSTFGSPMRKRFTFARPLFLSPPNYEPEVQLKTDYDTNLSSLLFIATSGSGSPWDTSPWDTSAWDQSDVPSLVWQPLQGIGIAASIAFGVTSLSDLIYNGVDVMFEPGGPL